MIRTYSTGKTEYQTTKTNKARRSASFERRPSKRYSQRTLQMKVTTAKPEQLSIHNNILAQRNGSQQAWDVKSTQPMRSSIPSGPMLVEIENLQRSPGSNHNRKWLSAARTAVNTVENSGTQGPCLQPGLHIETTLTWSMNTM